MSCVIKLKGTGSISADREVINKNFECLLGKIEDVNIQIDSGNITLSSDNITNTSLVEGATVTAALNTINTALASIPTSNSLLIVNTLPELPNPATEGDYAYIKDIQVLNTPVSAIAAYVDGAWQITSRKDAISYVTDLDDTISSPGFNTSGATVSDMKGMTLSNFIDTYAFPTVLASISSQASLSLVDDAPNIVEIGTPMSVSLTASFSKGSITNGNGSSGPSLVGDPIVYIFNGPGIPNSGISVTTSSLSVVLDGSNPSFAQFPATATQNWIATVSHSAGVGLYYDSKNNVSNNLDSSRNSGTETSQTSPFFGRYYAFSGSNSIPTNSTEVRASVNKDFLSSNNTGTFDINIPAGVNEVYFSIPAGKNISVLYVESLNADVTSTFASSSFDVNDGGGTPVAYETWSAVNGVNGYPEDATYRVTIS